MQPIKIKQFSFGRSFEIEYTEEGMKCFRLFNEEIELLSISAYQPDDDPFLSYKTKIELKAILEDYNLWVTNRKNDNSEHSYFINNHFQIHKHLESFDSDLFEISFFDKSDDHLNYISDKHKQQFTELIKDTLSNEKHVVFDIPWNLSERNDIQFEFDILNVGFFELLFLLGLNEIQKKLQQKVELLIGNFKVNFSRKAYNIASYMKIKDNVIKWDRDEEYDKIDAFKSSKSKYFNLLENNPDHLTKSIISLMNHLEKDPFSNPGGLDYVNYWIRKFEIGKNLGWKKLNEDIYEVFIEKNDGSKINLINMGFGVSQIVSIILTPFNYTFDNDYHVIDEYYSFGAHEDHCMYTTERINIYLEEPESNLHPKWQSLLVELLVDHQKRFSINYLVETHSEYMIRKLQYLRANKSISKEDLCIYYFNSDEVVSDEEPKVKEIIVRDDGILANGFGPGFYDEATKLTIDLLTVKSYN